MRSKFEAKKRRQKKRKKSPSSGWGSRFDGLAEAAGEVRRGKLSGDLGGDNLTAGVYGVMV